MLAQAIRRHKKKDGKLYPEDVFSTYLYTGNGTTQTINNGIDLAGEGGMVWVKDRISTFNHALVDSDRGSNQVLCSNFTTANQDYNTNGAIENFSSSGFDVRGALTNASDYNYASWTFRKAPKFFTQELKVHTNGTASTVDLSSLGEVGMVTVKATNAASDWYTWHRGLTAGNNLKLNLTDAQSTTSAYLSVSGTTLTIDSTAPSATYIVYAWAHDTSADGIIQCGSFTAAIANDPIGVTFEPQFLMIKRVDSAQGWRMIDVMRGIPVGGPASWLYAESSGAEITSGTAGNLSATDFYQTFASSGTYIYLAIRRPNKVPTSGTEVFQPIVYTGTNADNRLVNTTIAPDMVMVRERNDTTPLGMAVASRLTGDARLQTSSTSGEIVDADSFMTPTVSYGNSFSAMNGFGVGNDSTCKVNIDTTANNHIALAFKRAKGFFDVVCYTGSSSAITINHSLGVIPELIIAKVRSNVRAWVVYFGDKSKYLQLNTNTAQQNWTNYLSTVTETAITVNLGESLFNENSEKYVAYLFASCPGVSKVGSYTGNGTSQTINCGFTTGARFILIKRTDSTGDWYVWDSVRGIVAANDPHLSLNTTAAEVTTDDSVDPDSSGFIVNQNATTNINVTSATYIYLSIA